MSEIQRGTLWGYTRKQQHKGFFADVAEADDIELADIVYTPAFLNQHGDTGFSRMHPAYKETMKEQNDNLVSMLGAGEMREFTGHMRWVVTLLAMLNEVPVSTQHIQRQGMMRVGLTKRQPYVDFHKVTLRLPKKSPLPTSSARCARPDVVPTKCAPTGEPTCMKRCAYEEHEWEYDTTTAIGCAASATPMVG